MSQKILFKYASRSRVNNFFRGLDSIVSNLSNKEDYHVLCTFDVDDAEYKNRKFIDRLLSYKNVTYYFGISQNKIDAINRDLGLAPDFDILVNMSDDFIFTQPGFDEVIREGFKHFPDLDGFLHFNDGNQPRLATMSIIGKKWFDRTGYIYHSSYITEWCDNEEQCKAQKLGKYKYMGDDVKITLHIHPYHGHQHAMDELYRKNMVMSKADQINFTKRQKKNFPL